MRARRVDGNQKPVADHLSRCGWRVFLTSAVGRGFPDLVVARRGFTALVEVKNPTKPIGDQQLTEPQQRFWKDWPGVKIIAKSPEDAERQLNLAESFQYLKGFGETK